MSDVFRLGILGCGKICAAYFKGCRQFDVLRIDACADLDTARARAVADEFGVPRVLTVDELLADPDIDGIVNLTIPAAHAPLNRRILEAGKHAYAEKPFGVSRAESADVLAVSEQSGRLVGCAPDTFLGPGLQTCRKLIDGGAIGEPLAACAFFAARGLETWHPNPEFFFKEGGGPVLDMGPYYLTALVNVLGPIRRVSALARAGLAERIITSQPLHGQRIQVEVPTHYCGAVEFVSGPIATVSFSFDVYANHLPRLEIYGTEGSLAMPDPNGFGGPVFLSAGRHGEWKEMELTHPYHASRGIGVANLALAARSSEPLRPTGALAFHVLDAMLALREASDQKRAIDLTTSCERPAAVPVTPLPFTMKELAPTA